MITAANDSQSLEIAMSLGIMDYLMKPFEYTRLKKALDMFVYQAVVRKRLEKGPKMHQQDIDKVFLDSPVGETVQKGIQEKTLEMIRAYVAQIGDRPLSSEEVAEQNGVSVVTARKYMNYLGGKSRGDQHRGLQDRRTAVYSLPENHRLKIN